MKYGDTWQITEKPPNPKIAEIIGRETFLAQILQPFVTSRIPFKKSSVFVPRLKLSIIPEIQAKVSTHAEIFIIAFEPEATEFINA